MSYEPEVHNVFSWVAPEAEKGSDESVESVAAASPVRMDDGHQQGARGVLRDVEVLGNPKPLRAMICRFL